MRVIQFIILVVVLGWCFMPVHVSGNDVGMAQTLPDSIIAPNVFSPNSLIEEHKFFLVKSSDNQPVSLKVYTRAGVLVFSIEAKLCAWDGCSLSGKPLASGVYYYTAEVRGSSQKISKSGFVHLYR